MRFASATLLVAFAFGAEAAGADAPKRPSGSAPSAPDTREERARAGLLPRKPAAPYPAPDGAPAAVEPAAAAVTEEPAADRVVPLADVVLGAMRSRAAPANDEAEPPRPGDTSIEDLRVRVSGARVDSVLVGRAGGFTITVQTGAAAPTAGTAGSSAASAARPQVTTPAPAAAPVTAAASASPPSPPAPAAALAPVVALAPATAPSPAAPPPRAEPTPAEGPSILLLRRSTAAGDVIKRTLDPSSGLVTERRFDRIGRLVAQDAVDVQQLTLVSQARDPQGRIVQLVRDASGALIQILRDPAGRFLQAWIVPR